MRWINFAVLLPTALQPHLMSDSPKTVLEGSVNASHELTELHVPFHVPLGTTSIHLTFSYTGREQGNAIDLGLLGLDKEFKGYSGGSKSEVLVANDEATPGYIPGLIAPGEWYVLLGVYSVKEPAKYRIEITLGDQQRPVFTPNPAPTRIDNVLKRPFGARPRPRWLKGDFHMHTVYSDGQYTLDILVGKAKERDVDFIFSTEHNTFSANDVWGNHAPADLLVGRGIEVTTRKGHWNAIGLLPTQFVDPHTRTDDTLRQAVHQVHQQDGFAIINHPYGECKCCDWDFDFIDEMDAIEVWNGPWKRHPEDQSNEQAVAKWDELLRQGKFFVATGGSDTHEPKFFVAEPCTHVLAEDVSTAAIIRSLRNAQAYVTQHPTFEIDFQLLAGGDTAENQDVCEDWQHSSQADIGEALESTNAVASVTLRGFPGDSELRIITDQGVQLKRNAHRVRWPVQGRYVRVEVRFKDGSMLGLTNPIWLK